MIEKIQKLLNDNGCERLVLSSGYSGLKEVLDTIGGTYDDIIEIGTHNGLSAAVLTEYGRRVFTFDIALRNSEYVWNLLRVRHKISSFVGTGIKYEIDYIRHEWKDLNFNFAFVDGWHEYYSTKADFEMVKFCGRVLFHDYDSSSGVQLLCNEIGAKKIEHNFALWEAS